MPDDGSVGRARRTHTAILHALTGEWELAVAANRALIEEAPGDVETARRLAKALMQTGALQEAAAVYRQVLQSRPDDALATANLDRITKLVEPRPDRFPTALAPSSATPRPRSDQRPVPTRRGMQGAAPDGRAAFGPLP